MNLKFLTITHLTFVDDFNKPLNKSNLNTEKLKHLTVGKNFTQKVEEINEIKSIIIHYPNVPTDGKRKLRKKSSKSIKKSRKSIRKIVVSARKKESNKSKKSRRNNRKSIKKKRILSAQKNNQRRKSIRKKSITKKRSSKKIHSTRRKLNK